VYAADGMRYNVGPVPPMFAISPNTFFTAPSNDSVVRPRIIAKNISFLIQRQNSMNFSRIYERNIFLRSSDIVQAIDTREQPLIT
jgi:hypothetical protein